MFKTKRDSKTGLITFGDTVSWPKKPEWDATFTPSYTPEEMLKMGVFEGKYINAPEIKDKLPKSWFKHDRVLGPDDEPDAEVNYFGVKSREPLSKWKERGNLTVNSPLGSFMWYCLYFLGRRLEKEDQWQIKRWRALISRHQGGIASNCKLNDLSCRARQRQALLNWYWDSTTLVNKEQFAKNRERLARMKGINMGPHPSKDKASNESYIVMPPSSSW